MDSTSFIQRFLLENLGIRGSIVRLADVWQAMQRGRAYPDAAARLLGEMATASTVIAGNLRQPGRLTFQIQGHGPVSLLMVDCTKTLNLRGFARADDWITDAGLPTLIGAGHLQLSLETAELARPYQSRVPLRGASIAEIFVHYLEQSEQQPAGLWLACEANACAALFVQKLTGAEARDADGWARISTLAGTVRGDELLTLDPAAMLRRLFAEEDVRLYPARAVTHHWPPEPEKIAAMLRAIGEREIRAVLAQSGEVVVNDEFANHTYRFDGEAVDEIFQPRTLH